MNPFAKLGLIDKKLQSNLETLGYRTPTSIQEKSIGSVLAGADTYAIAPTGTGKTAAYLLPLLQQLSHTDNSEAQVRPMRALILVPTRELAQQVETSIGVYGKELKLRTIAIFGGQRIEAQTKRFKRGTDILVATPKRLMDLLKTKAFSLSEIEHFVMDEADRLVSMGIVKELKFILAALPKKKQMVFFSATDSKALLKFSQEIQRSPRHIQAEGEQPALEKIIHTMYRCNRLTKTKDLLGLLNFLDCDRALIFARTQNDVNVLCEKLNAKGFKSESLHNQIPQKKRQERLQGFKNGDFQYLVATDIASRGIDVANLFYVINYDLPVNANDYIHRVGRTARTNAASLLKSNDPALMAKQRRSKTLTSAKGRPIPVESLEGEAIYGGKKAKTSEIRGHSISLVSAEQARLVERIEKIVGKEVKLERMPLVR